MNKQIKLQSFFLKHKATAIFALISILCYGLSLISLTFISIESESKQVQKHLTSRQKTLAKFAEKALVIPANEWLDFEDLPDDMVLYRYSRDTLQSWVNLFPISNDEVDIVPWWYRMHDMSSRNYFNTPLAYLRQGEQYVNLGSSWYVIKVYRNRDVKIITGLFIKTEYISENSLLSNKINSKLHLSKKYTTVPINLDDGNPIFGQDGEALFSIINNIPLKRIGSNSLMFKWISLCFALLAIFAYHGYKKSRKSFIITILGLIAARITSIVMSKDLVFSTKIFSPSLYADTDFFNSLGDLLLNHLFTFLFLVALYMNRKILFKEMLYASIWKKTLIRTSLIILIIAIVSYIHITLKSTILNSSIVLELYRIQENSIYSILIYIFYALLFLGLLMGIQTLIITFRKRSNAILFNAKGIFLYIFLVSIYTISTVAYYGFEREFEITQVFASKLSTERDLSLELELMFVENKIASDPIISLVMPFGGEMIKGRLSERYFWDLRQEYEIHVTICGVGDSLGTDIYAHNVDCFDYFNNDLINKFGIPISARSAFYYINNYNSESNYIGVFSYLTNSRRYNMYLEVDSKLISEEIGYPTLLIDSKNNKQINIPSIYSYGKFYDNRLTSYNGRYNYPYRLGIDVEEGASIEKIGGYIHFMNKTLDESTIIISRPIRSIRPYLISFSYILLFFSSIILGGLRIYHKLKKKPFQLPKRSFRKKITYLLTTSLVFSLICMGVGSIIFTINLIEESNRLQMEEKLQSVQSTLTEICKYAAKYTDINTNEMYQAMDMVATNTQVDINLYDPHGRLIRSTKPEVFNQSLISSRINPKAYYNLVHRDRREVIQEEYMAGLKYYSLYAPIFNSNGELITIANIPYFMNTSQLHGGESSSIIAAIINLYILLLIAAFLGGSAISNSITKPLSEISSKLKTLGSTQKAEHINYKNRDELGILVNTYNKMVGDLEKSTKQLAESEREQAWKEMARQIAHEIKNPLTPMKLSIQHLIRMKKQNVPNWEDRFEAVSSSVIEQIDILSETATAFSNFAKFYNEEDAIIDLLILIKEQLILFDNRENISLSFISDLKSAIVIAKKNQLTRALVNLISNAIQAVELKDHGIVRVSMIQEKEFYKIEVEDNGVGVSNDNQHKLFKPNFTTKSGGTGLGLAICKSIMDQSNGDISYSKSELGGANFTIRLPIFKS